MAKQNRTTLKGYFETGDTPSQAQYADLIDSNLNLLETDSISVINITASGDISSSGNLTVSQSFTLGAPTSSILAGGELLIKSSDSGNEYLKITDNKFQVFIQGSQILNVDNDSINLNASNQDIDIKMTYDNAVNAFDLDAGTNRLKLRDFITIGSGSVPHANPNALLVSGSSRFTGDITASEAISASLISTSSFGSLKIMGSSVDFSGLPTSDPGVAGRLYNDSGTVKISL